MIDSIEGDIVVDLKSVFVGQQMNNGWKNSGLPKPNSLDPKLMMIPKIE